ncbi:NAD(P)/FAD-dependent oxidoreductase [Sphingomonas sp. ID0503]|uniref:NAD(P)/FAD-dependent oxidoreductase n=1 Tax=Sphingomonas sp. ID0503 TaxID=3399691 RepID=UPI003AFB5CE1
MESEIIECDVAIVGAGMAGASLAAEIGLHRSVVMIEAEAHPGFHATGRSAAFWSETYGGPGVTPLTKASFDFLNAPPQEFSERGFLTPRGCLHIARDETKPLLDAMLAAFAGSGVDLGPADPAIPGLRPEWRHAVAEPSCTDIDVGGLHAAYLRAAKRAGVRLVCDAPLGTAEWAGGRWMLSGGKHRISAGLLVDAAGAWADDVARMAGVEPIGIAPLRRTVMQLRVDPPAAPDLPLVMDAGGAFYFKPVAGGRLWLSPADETPDLAGDVAADELDVARAIDSFSQAVDWRVEAVERRWAGLRSFAPDRLPVYGFDPAHPGFFWFAGQGGFGIQTAPAAAQTAAALLLDRPAAPMVAGIDPAPYAPDRFLKG